jgi:hypothetical protein
MLRRIAKKVANKVFNSHVFREAIRAAILSEETRSQLQKAFEEVVESPEFRNKISPHLFGLMLSPELQGMDPNGVASRVDRGTQLLLAQGYRERLQRNDPTLNWTDAGFRAFSPVDEDGLLLYLFALLGTGPRTVVELGAGAGYDGLSANWIINHGFHGLLLEAEADAAAKAKLFYETRPETCLTPPRVECVGVSGRNVNQLLQTHGFTGETDLLSIDLDGLDYWAWKNLTVLSPRVVAVKYHPAWGADEARTVPDAAEFVYSEEKSAYGGASLLAFDKLGLEKGYHLVGFNRAGSVAFFVRNDLKHPLLPTKTVADGLSLDRHRLLRETLRPLISRWDWTVV